VLDEERGAELLQAFPGVVAEVRWVGDAPRSR
jgi:hypothetical protein